MPQVVGNLMRISLLPNTDIARLSVDLGGIGENGPAHTLFDDLLVFDVVVREDAEKDDGEDEESSESRPKKRVSQAATKAFCARNFYFNGHVPSRRRMTLFISPRLMAGQSYLLVL